MNVRPTRTFVRFLCFVSTCFLLNLSCNKEDESALLDAVLEKEVSYENTQDSKIEQDVIEDDEEITEAMEEETEGIEIREDLESRTTTFYPIHDAYLQNGKGYDQPIIRLQENLRTSFLMFDLTQIDSIGGLISSVSLEFVISQDEGNGKIQVFKGASNNWTETDLSQSSAPEIDLSLGEIQQKYEVNSQVSIDLNAAEVFPELSTFILNHKDGDDLAFASKENKSRGGSKLTVTYNAPIGSETIVQNNEESLLSDDIEEGTEEEIGEEEATDGERPEEGSTEVEAPEDETTPEENSEEETATDESPEEGSTEVEAPEDETTPEENSEEETATDESPEEESVEDESAEEETIEEETKTQESVEEEAAEEATKEENTSDETTDEPTEEETAEEETTEEESMEEEATEVENTSDETTEEPTAEETTEVVNTMDETSGEPVEGETTVEVTTNEETVEEETTEEESIEEQATEEENASDETTEEPIEGETEEEATTTEEANEEETTEEENSTEETTEEEITKEEETTTPPMENSNMPPTAKADASVSSGFVPLKVSFSGSNSSDDKAISAYNWNFKDGAKASKADVVHSFIEAGSYDVELTVIDEEGLNSVDRVTITVKEKTNEPPVAKSIADVLSGTAPLEITFNGSKSTDDNSLASYFWDFKDGTSSNETNPKHTFDTPGSYNVKLTVEDGNGLKHEDSVTITVNAPKNEAPKATATANVLSGDAPLKVDFSGGNSSDDKGILDYEWNFKDGNTATDTNPAHTFTASGTYPVELTVTDNEGLKDTAILTITVNEGSPVSTGGGQIPCSAGGGKANETGAKIWCWNNVSVPSGGPSNKSFSGGELAVGSECSPNQVTRVGNRLKFHVNPTTPQASNWCSNDFNMRAEIRTSPWPVNQPAGTEGWFGWNYTYGDDYIIDREIPWAFFQLHEATTGQSPLISLWTIKAGGGGSGQAGEIHIVNATGSNNTYHPTGIVPRAGETVDIVMHVIWGDAGNGLLQVWMNGNKVHDRQERTVRASNPVGGNAKFGIYKWKWRNEDGIQKSRQQGITHLDTYMGPLRIITRRPGDSGYGKDSYNEVAP